MQKCQMFYIWHFAKGMELRRGVYIGLGVGVGAVATTNWHDQNLTQTTSWKDVEYH
jgi:hypothetical protein